MPLFGPTSILGAAIVLDVERMILVAVLATAVGGAAVLRLIVQPRLRNRDRGPTKAGPIGTPLRLALLTESLAVAFAVATVIVMLLGLLPESILGTGLPSAPLSAVVERTSSVGRATLLVGLCLVLGVMALFVIKLGAAPPTDEELKRKIEAMKVAAAAGALPPLPPNEELKQLIDAVVILDEKIASLGTDGALGPQRTVVQDAQALLARREALIEAYVDKDLDRRIAALISEHAGRAGSDRRVGLAESAIAFFLRNELLASLRAAPAFALTLAGYVFLCATALLLARQLETVQPARLVSLAPERIVPFGPSTASNRTAVTRTDALTEGAGRGIDASSSTHRAEPAQNPSKATLPGPHPSLPQAPRNAAKLEELEKAAERLAADAQRLGQQERRLSAKSEEIDVIERQLIAKSELLDRREEAVSAADLALKRKIEQEQRRSADAEMQRHAEAEASARQRAKNDERLVIDVERVSKQREALETKAADLQRKEQDLTTAAEKLETTAVEQRRLAAEAEKMIRDREQKLAVEAERIAGEDHRLSTRAAELEKERQRLAAMRDEITRSEAAAEKSRGDEQARAAAQTGRLRADQERIASRGAEILEQGEHPAAKANAPETKEQQAEALAKGAPAAQEARAMRVIDRAGGAKAHEMLKEAQLRCSFAEAQSMLRVMASQKAHVGAGSRRQSVEDTMDDVNSGRRSVECGQVLLLKGDVAAARILFTHAANAGLADGSMALGTTYDPVALTKASLPTSYANPDLAREWYRKALALRKK